MDAQGKLDGQPLYDAAFAALAANERPAAQEYFRRAIDAAEPGSLSLAPQQVYDTRRAVTELDRDWGGYAALTYRGAAGVPGSVPAGEMGDDVQWAAEVWWRPAALTGNGTFVDVYARAYEMLYSQNGGTVGNATTQGVLGVRWKPLASQSVIFSFERLLRIGNLSLADWLARLSYSNGFGADLRVDAPSWWTGDVYAETGRYLQEKSYYATTQARLGRSYRMPALDLGSTKAVLWPYAVLAADYNSVFATPKAIGAGAGVNLRYWFGEDRYQAPRRYVDFSVQYRHALSGDERAGGLFAQVIFGY
jgi:hypothetical protein